MFRKNSLFLLFGLILTSLVFGFRPVHKFYMGIFELNYQADTQALEVTGRLFTDDFESALSEAVQTKVVVDDAAAKDQVDEYIEAYLAKNFTLKVEGKKVKLKYLGKEVEEDITWVYMEAEQLKSFEDIWVENRVISEIQEKQTNVIYLFKGKEERSLLLKSGQWSESASFK